MLVFVVFDGFKSFWVKDITQKFNFSVFYYNLRLNFLAIKQYSYFPLNWTKLNILMK